MAERGKDPIHIQPSHEGRLHRALGLKEGEHIPLELLERKLKTAGPVLRREIEFAINERHWKH